MAALFMTILKTAQEKTSKTTSDKENRCDPVPTESQGVPSVSQVLHCVHLLTSWSVYGCLACSHCWHAAPRWKLWTVNIPISFVRRLCSNRDLALCHACSRHFAATGVGMGGSTEYWWGATTLNSIDSPSRRCEDTQRFLAGSQQGFFFFFEPIGFFSADCFFLQCRVYSHWGTCCTLYRVDST